MAIPVVYHVLPFGASVGDAAEGPTAGRSLVEIYGRNFRLPPTPAADGPLGPISGGGLVTAAEPRTVSVTFGGVEVVSVAVVSPILLRVITPISPIAATKAAGYGAGDVDVVVTNLDDDEDPIAGETVTVTDGYAYRHVKLDATAPSDLLRLVRALLREWKRQVLPEVILTVHTDFDAETADALNIVELATMPAIILSGPSTPENRFYSRPDQEGDELVDGQVRIQRKPRTVDLEFDLTAVSDSTMEILNLLAAANRFMDQNPFLYMDRDASDPSAGQVRYEFGFQLGGDFELASNASSSNIRSFSGAIRIRGFDFEGFAGFPLDAIRGLTTLLSEGVSLDVEPNPG